MEPGDLATATIVNYQTPALTRRAFKSFRKHYADVPLILIDNGSRDEESRQILEECRKEDASRTEVISNNENLHHGPAMEQALRHARSPFVLFLDSDVEVIEGGFLEMMTTLANGNAANYAIGQRVWMNKRGFMVRQNGGGFAYIRPHCMLVKRELYLKLPKFQRHGAPCLDNMITAARLGFGLLDFPVHSYVNHSGRGTAGKFGYELGLRGKCNYLLNKLGL